jgi:cysteine desulfurase family protein
MIYFDNAATSWPKPDVMLEAMSHFVREVGANPGRSGHRMSAEAERVRYGAREVVAEMFGLDNPLQIVFTPNATAALNTAILGILNRGDHVVTTSMEHNSVMRPLRALEENDIEITEVRCRPDGTMDLGEFECAIIPRTKLIVTIHASNVCGTIMPVREIGAIAGKYGIPFLVDAAQTAGAVPIDIVADNIDLLSFTGHKGLLGPTGTGGLAFAPDFDIEKMRPLYRGGTGSKSETQHQPDFMPDKYESGTCNIIGLAGLAESMRWIQEKGGVEKIRGHEVELTSRLIEGLDGIDGVTVYGTKDATKQTAAVSFNISGVSQSDAAERFGDEHDLMCRVGLHCSPAGHRTLGTFPNGTIRFATGPFNTLEEIDTALEAVAETAG